MAPWSYSWSLNVSEALLCALYSAGVYKSGHRTLTFHNAAQPSSPKFLLPCSILPIPMPERPCPTLLLTLLLTTVASRFLSPQYSHFSIFSGSAAWSRLPTPPGPCIICVSGSYLVLSEASSLTHCCHLASSPRLSCHLCLSPSFLQSMIPDRVRLHS